MRDEIYIALAIALTSGGILLAADRNDREAGGNTEIATGDMFGNVHLVSDHEGGVQDNDRESRQALVGVAESRAAPVEQPTYQE